MVAVDTRGVLRIEDADGVRLLTLNRPDALNAFNQDLWHATTDALEEAANDDGLRCVVLTGEGRAFSAGQDLGEMSDPSIFEHEEPGYNRFMPVMESFPKPVIAAVNGIGVGIGMTILAHCDLAYIADTAKLKAPFISLGVTTEASASLLFPVMMGWQRAAEVLYTEPWVSPEQAVDLGLALKVCPAGELMDEAMAAARHIGALPLGPLLATKALLHAARLSEVQAARERESAAFVNLIAAMGNT